ncbi:MAG: REP element-mobilizing transposase RayT [Gammaproteobacteria bacterium]|jgi:REP element-mobilizing transposase RayT
MGYPRHLHVPPEIPGIYHCMSRCVRRAFLCGQDPITGRSLNHRKQWLEDRVIELAKLFAVAVHSYAIMSNHFHVVLETDPRAPLNWSDEEVARRWLRLSPNATADEMPTAARIAAITTQPTRLAVLRQRLGSLSWFMRYLKEPIARRANREDECTGRFWEGRFRTQALLDDCAIVACMVYVDLNPVRAGTATTIETSSHSSAQVRALARGQGQEEGPIRPLASSIHPQFCAMSTAQYLELVNWTSSALHPVTKDIGSTDAPRILVRLGLKRRQWLAQVPATESQYYGAIGGVEALIQRARNAGRKWVRGIGTAREVERIGTRA